VTEPATPTGPFSGRTPWSRSLQAPLRAFLQTESGSAGVLLLATVAGLVWANLAPEAYAVVWENPLTIRLGDVGLTLTVREWVNSGLMTFFFFVVGLEARREFDLGELRQRRRATLPVLAGIGGMTVPVVIFLALNARRDSAVGWGVTMSTDTAFALGLLALVARGLPDRVRIFLLTVVVVDDLVAVQGRVLPQQ
jgi:Na+/H+ antiporter NhaA